jgi:mannose-1-phosphate guanylyltransferase
MTKTVDAYAVILAGGSGTRFWPASTPDRPKQLLPLAGDRPLVVQTLDRATALVGRERIRLVAGADLTRQIRREVPWLTEGQCLIEPQARGTGPALAWAASQLVAVDPSGVMISMHADHRIEPLDHFTATVDEAVEYARLEHRLVCIGAEPDRPETGYGYLKLGRAQRGAVFDVERFVEKPDPETADRYVASGRYLWNTGIFVWRAADLLAEIERSTPEIRDALPCLRDADPEAFFSQVEPISVDVGVMERAEKIGVVKARFQWDDVGVWDSLSRTRPVDADGNVHVGDARFVDAGDNVVWTESRRATLFGVDELIIVESGDEILVMTRDRAAQLKTLLERLRNR